MSTRVPYRDRWEPPTPTEVSEAVVIAGGRVRTALMLKKNIATIDRWRSGRVKIDYANWIVLNGRY